MSLKSVVFVSLGNLSLGYLPFRSLSQYNTVQYSTKQYNSLFAQKTQKTRQDISGGGVGVPGTLYNLDLYLHKLNSILAHL